MSKFPLTKEVEHKARLLALAGDPTRIRIFCMLFEQKEACVSEIAEALGMSVARVSHHLQMLRDNGLFESQRDGNSICYKLAKTSFTKKIKSIICD
jgi:DNA-binding transcriptional ArsR family regulator